MKGEGSHAALPKSVFDDRRRHNSHSLGQISPSNPIDFHAQPKAAADREETDRFRAAELR